MKIDTIRKNFNQNEFINLIGFESENLEERAIKLKLSIREELLNNNGSLHGGVHATMLDTILGMTIRYKTKLPCTTINLNINYLNTATSDEVYATGKILRQGYKNVTAEGEMYDSNGVLLAKAIGTFKLLRQ
ncbi:PaaI family thioesterase [Solibacillus sp. FSL K6-1523]|uniref:PaaI family thioesterase n=1 Tax=Solibacillus sp. FSL K6-1523 TaxID=2921471 RepID=UPI0030F8CE04